MVWIVSCGVATPICRSTGKCRRCLLRCLRHRTDTHVDSPVDVSALMEERLLVQFGRSAMGFAQAREDAEHAARTASRPTAAKSRRSSRRLLLATSSKSQQSQTGDEEWQGCWKRCRNRSDGKVPQGNSFVISAICTRDAWTYQAIVGASAIIWTVGGPISRILVDIEGECSAAHRKADAVGVGVENGGIVQILPRYSVGVEPGYGKPVCRASDRRDEI
jgi:hypothetical protein